MTNEQLVELIQQDIDKQQNLEQLYLQNKGFIFQVAKRYNGLCELDDLTQQGFLGLCEACDRFDECKGDNFLSYAGYYIRQSMSRYVKEQQNTVRVPEHQQEQIKRYEKIVNDYLLRTSKRPSDRLLMLHLGISKQQLQQLKKDAEMLRLQSLDAPLSVEDETITLADSVADPENHIESVDDGIQNEQCAQVIWGIVDTLEPEQSTLIHEKYECCADMKTLADKLGKTIGETRNIENRAMRELRKHHNRKKLQPFFYSDNQYYSLGLTGAGLATFNRTWTSAPERAILLAEKHSH